MSKVGFNMAKLNEKKMIDEIDNSNFNLTISLRSHLSGTVSEFVNYFIDGDIENASRLTDSIYDEGYSMYCTRNLEAAKSYCRNKCSPHSLAISIRGFQFSKSFLLISPIIRHLPIHIHELPNHIFLPHQSCFSCHGFLFSLEMLSTYHDQPPQHI